MSTATRDNAGWLAEYTVAGAGEKTITFKTENTFLDADARVVITTPAASNPTFSADDIVTGLSMGTASSGVYNPTVTITGNANIATSGFIATGNYTLTDTNVKIGTVNQSTLKNGATAISSGATVNPTDANQTINISEGYNAAQTVIVGPISAGPKGTVTSGSATIDTLNYAYNTTNSNFTVTGASDVSAPTVNIAGFISSSAGTKNGSTGGAVVTASVPKIAIAASLTGVGTKMPSITKNAATNIAAGSATTTKPSSGYYIAVSSGKNTANISATAAVITAGYGTATEGQYTTTPSSNLEVGADASAVTYVPITEATFANAATGGTTYTDISSSGPILISGDYLYINAGYTTAKKISLARLVPDATGTNASAAYILNGYTAYNNDGALIVGTMQNYQRDYEVT